MRRKTGSSATSRMRTICCTALSLALGAVISSCATGESEPGSSIVRPVNPDGKQVDLSGVCPETVVFQTDWNPEAEHGFLYQMVGTPYKVDAERVRVSGDLIANGQPTGVRVEVRSGGPAIGYGQVTAELYKDPSIMLGFVGTDQALSNSADFPTLAVVAPFNINPQIIMWDPDTYPEVESIADLKNAGVKVRYRDGVSYMDYLVASGQLSPEQIDATYDGTPAEFVAAGGKDAQQGFGTSEPYFYEKVVKDWLKPVRYQYVHETGWTAYAQSLAGTPDAIDKNDACLKKLVPVIQQAQIDYLESPDVTNAIILDLVVRFNNGWAYDAGQATAAVSQMQTDKLVSNSPDGTLGSFDLARVSTFIEKARPVFEKAGDKVKAGVSAEDLVTNRYIDPALSLK